MDKHVISTISKELQVAEGKIVATLKMMEEGATIPFMARYRKEVTGNLDEVQLRTIRDRNEQLQQLARRKLSIVDSLKERDLLTEELAREIESADSLSRLEDLYLPFRPKRRTRATVAREKGLEALAQKLFDQKTQQSAEALAKDFVHPEKGVENEEAALQGARDIIAEWINEDANTRALMRKMFQSQGKITAKLLKGKEEEGKKYRDYFNWEEKINKIPSHRLLALFRAEKESILTLNIRPDEDDALFLLNRRFVKSKTALGEQVKLAAKDTYKRLMAPSIETEVRVAAKKQADEEAIQVFADNLNQLLLASPLGEKRVLAIDPGFRTGCKVVCLSKQGDLLENTTIYPHPPQNRAALAAAALIELIKKHKIEAIAVGNGTAGRETETFLRSLALPGDVPIVMVNEAGASVYSASELAREELPEQDVTVRGAVSIGRRLMDPLAELVKIDPKSIGVGQYQHDVDQGLLKKSLDDTVISCVNAVGVEVNTASPQLLSYVSGLGPGLAQNIIEYRAQNGPYQSREDLLKVPRLGPKAFEQCAGFLRIRDGIHPLDNSAVHPESYGIVDNMASDLGVKIPELISNESLQKAIALKKYVTDKVGIPTLKDILKELAKPGRDPRAQFELFAFEEGVQEIEDLREGMVLPGIVTNIVDFGAFVDIGVHQDGLVHISQITKKFIKHPSEAVKVNQRVQVKVVGVDLDRKRISLSMKI